MFAVITAVLLTIATAFTSIVASTSIIVEDAVSNQAAHHALLVAAKVEDVLRTAWTALALMHIAQARGALAFDGGDVTAQDLAEQKMYDIAETHGARGASYLNLATEADGAFLGIEPNGTTSNLHIRNATTQPARISLLGHALGAARPSSLAPGVVPTLVSENYDPRERGWYREVVARSQNISARQHRQQQPGTASEWGKFGGSGVLAVWSDLYQFTGTGRIGILLGAAHIWAHNGTLRGVVGVDVVVSQIGTLMAAMVAEANGTEVYLVDGDARIIAGSSDPPGAGAAGPVLTPLARSAVLQTRLVARDPGVHAAIVGAGAEASLGIGGLQDGVLAVRIVALDPSLAPRAWKVVAVAGQDSFRARLSRSMMWFIGSMAVCFAAVLAAADAFASRIAQPLDDVVRQLSGSGAGAAGGGTGSRKRFTRRIRELDVLTTRARQLDRPAASTK
jgi:hypothetical protein